MIAPDPTVAFVTDRSGVQRDLLARRGERPGDLETALLTEVEAQLTRWTQPFRMVGTESRAGHAITDGTEVTLLEEATLARHLRTT